MKEFEYKIIHSLDREYTNLSLEMVLNMLGAEGWEVIRINDVPKTLTGYIVAKREKNTVQE